MKTYLKEVTELFDKIENRIDRLSEGLINQNDEDTREYINDRIEYLEGILIHLDNAIEYIQKEGEKA